MEFTFSLTELLALSAPVLAGVGAYIRAEYMGRSNAKAAEKLAVAVKEISKELHDLHIKIANEYASHGSLEKVEARLTMAVTELRQEVGKLHEQLGRLPAEIAEALKRS